MKTMTFIPVLAVTLLLALPGLASTDPNTVVRDGSAANAPGADSTNQSSHSKGGRLIASIPDPLDFNASSKAEASIPARPPVEAATK